MKKTTIAALAALMLAGALSAASDAAAIISLHSVAVIGEGSTSFAMPSVLSSDAPNTDTPSLRYTILKKFRSSTTEETLSMKNILIATLATLLLATVASARHELSSQPPLPLPSTGQGPRCLVAVLGPAPVKLRFHPAKARPCPSASPATIAMTICA